VKEISSRETRTLKWLLPAFVALWLVAAALAIGRGSSGVPGDWPYLVVFWAIPVALFPVLYVKYTWPLADRVDDDGDSLVVHRRGVQSRIPLAQIKDVSSHGGRTFHVTLHLRTPGPFGDQVEFLAPNGFRLPFSRHPLVDDLVARVDRAHREGTQ
jgi:membrane protein implicated in regulation of membrane protease activity